MPDVPMNQQQAIYHDIRRVSLPAPFSEKFHLLPITRAIHCGKNGDKLNVIWLGLQVYLPNWVAREAINRLV